MAGEFVLLEELDGKQAIAPLLAIVLEGILGKAAVEAAQGKAAEAEAQNKYDVVVQQLVLAAGEKIFSASESDVDAVFSLAFACLSRVEQQSSAEFVSTVGQLSALLSSNAVNAYPATRLTLLISLFNTVSVPSPAKAVAFVSALRYSVAANLSKIFVNQLASLEKLIPQWQVSDQQRADIYLAVARVCEANAEPESAEPTGWSGQSSPAQTWLFRYLQSSLVNEESQRVATNAVLDALRRRSASQLDRLYTLPVVQSLSKSSPKVFQLLEIFANDNAQGFLEFSKQNDVASLGAASPLDAEALLIFIRSLAICSMVQSRRRLEFDLLQRTLGLPEGAAGVDAAQSAVLDAVQLGLIEGRIDEENDCVDISRAAPRGDAAKGVASSWPAMAAQLAAWKGGVLAVVDQLSEQVRGGPQQRMSGKAADDYEAVVETSNTNDFLGSLEGEAVLDGFDQ